MPSTRAVAGRTDDQVGQAVAVDVARRRHAVATLVACGSAVDHEPAQAHIGEVDRRGARLAEHHITAPSARAVAGCTNDQVVQAVAVDVARRRHAVATFVVCGDAVDHETAGGIADVCQVDGHEGIVISRRRSTRAAQVTRQVGVRVGGHTDRHRAFGECRR